MSPTPALTPEPWYARPVNSPNDDPNDGWELEGPPQPLGQGQFAKLADANMAAAAPTLFTSTKSLMTIIEQIESPTPEIQQALNQAQAAIQKAITPTEAHGTQAPLI